MEAVSAVYLLINNNLGSFGITGGVYKQPRPTSEDKEDIVIGSLPITFEQLQKGILNVNVHVPNLLLGINMQDSQPDYARISVLTGLVIKLLDNHYFGDSWLAVQQQQTFVEDSSSYSNIRVEIYSENI